MLADHLLGRASDLAKQVKQFKKGGGDPICLGIVGINSALVTTGYEGDRSFTTNGKNHKHPFQEADAAKRRIMKEAKPAFDELLVLPYRASNVPPYSFERVDLRAVDLDYGAIPTRISREYERRFK